MAIRSERSLSPVSRRPNPNSRNSENNTRRSFSGNPFARPSIVANPRNFNPVTPANSPAEYGRRHPVVKEGLVLSRSHEEKENEKEDHNSTKSVKFMLPAKSSKNFMSPTISAAYKITPSPKKKVLVEKNESFRTSVSFSDGKTPSDSKIMNFLDVGEDSETKVEEGSFQNTTEISLDSVVVDADQDQTILDLPISKASKLDPCPQVPSLLSESSSSKVQSSFSSVSPIIAPLDADPLLPPYDPKENYLSPRPMFLHYKPNPRIEAYFNKEKGVSLGEARRLEEAFISENLSESELSEETQSEDTLMESEDVSSAVIIPEEKPHVVEPIPISFHTTESTVDAKRPPKAPRFLKRSKSLSLLFLLMVASLSIYVTDSPFADPPLIKDFYEPYVFSGFAKENYDGFARNVKLWSAKSMSYLPKLVPIKDNCEGFARNVLIWSAKSITYLPKLIPFTSEQKLGHLQVRNLTAAAALQEELVVYEYNLVQYTDESEQNYETDLLDSLSEGNIQMDPLEDNTNGEVNDADYSEEPSEGLGNSEGEEVYQTEREINDSQEQSDFSFLRFYIEQQSSSNLHYESVLESEAEQLKSEMEEASEIKPAFTQVEETQVDTNSKPESTEMETSHESSAETDSATDDFAVMEVLDSSISVPEINFSGIGITVASSCLLALVAAAMVFIYLKQASEEKIEINVDPALNYKMISSAISIGGTENMQQQKPFSHNWETDVVMPVEESCPSEMSSFQKSSSLSKKELRGTSEAQSHERKPRMKSNKRESLASSLDYSMDSPSYGSFTTYEKLATGEDEVMTPVRRSIRIRKLVTSP